MFRKSKTATGDKAKTAIALGSGLVKSGYLVKRAKHSHSNWKKRYFVLNGHSLTYYKDIKSVSNAQGDLLLTDDTTCREVKEPGRGSCFEVTTAFATLRMEASNDEERRQWVQAIRKVVQDLEGATREYLWCKERAGAKWVHMFCVMHDDSITVHEDHMHTSMIQVAVKLNEGKVELVEKEGNVLVLRKDGTDVLFLRGEDEEIRAEFVKVITRAIKPQDDDDGDDSHSELFLVQGQLDVRADKHKNAQWELSYFTLTSTTLRRFDDEQSMVKNKVTEAFRITPQCAVFETNLRAHSFEVVTSKKVLHVAAPSQDIATDWISTLRRLITQSQVTEGPLLDLVKKRYGNHHEGELVGEDFYSVTFREKRPLGLVLERSAEWAIVKLANASDTGVDIGSVLYSVNDQPVTLNTYPETIALLTGWQPPLKLGFRRSPTMSGYLMKQARGRKTSVKNWKQRYFVLDQARLMYFDTEGGELKGDIPLIGSAVSLLSHSETGQFFSFRVVSGITAVVMRAATVDEMNAWAAVLYHASSMCNGGGYLLEVERERLEKKAEMTRKKDAVKEAEQEAQRRKEEAEKAAIAAKEAQRKAEEEAAEKESQEAAQQAQLEYERLEKERQEADDRARQEKEALDAEILQAEEEEKLREQREAEEAEKERQAQIEYEKQQAEADAAAQAAEEDEDFETIRSSVIVNDLGDSDDSDEEYDEDDEDDEEAKSAAVKQPETIAEEPTDDASEKPGKEESTTASEPPTASTSTPTPVVADSTPATTTTVPVAQAPASTTSPTVETPTPTPAPAAAVPTPVVTPAVEKRAAAAEQDVQVLEEPVSLMDSAVDDMELTEDLLETVFNGLNGGVTTGSINPMQLSIIVRLVTGKHNLFQEMKWFSAFDTDGGGDIDFQEFKDGFRSLESSGLAGDKTNQDVISALKSFALKSNFAL